MALLQTVALTSGAVLLAALYCESCNVSEIPVKGDLDLLPLSGRWFELKWRSYVNVPIEERFRDYEHHYKYDHKTGNIIINGYGRPTPQDKCFTYTGSLTTTSQVGKLIYTRPASVFGSNDTVRSDYWIVDTDYLNYILTYGCTKLLANGTCDPAHIESWLWGRSPRLPAALTTHVDDLMTRVLCVNPESYLETPHGDACVDGPIYGGQGIIQGGYVAIFVSLGIVAVLYDARA